MIDLNSTMFYKAKFTVRAKDPEKTNDLLWLLVYSSIRGWMLRKFNRGGHDRVDSDTRTWSRFKLGGRLFDKEEKGYIYAESCYYENPENREQVSWACRICEKTEPVEGFAMRDWITEIGYESTEKGVASISYVVTYTDQSGYVGLCQEQPMVSLPNVIRYLLENEDLICSIGADTLTAEPIPLKVGDYPMFEELLLRADRQVPVVYISPCRRDEETETGYTLIPADKLAASVAGNALVFYAEDPAFSEEMRECCFNSDYTCSGGSVRLYLPRFDLANESDSYRHRYLSPAFIEEHGADEVLNIFRRVLAQDVHYYQSMFRLEGCRRLVAEAAHRQRIEQQRLQLEDLAADHAGQVKTLREKLAETMAERDEAIEKRDEWEAIGDSCLKDCDQERERAAAERARANNLQTVVDMLQDKADRFDEAEQAMDGIRQMEEYPDTPTAVARYFQTVYGHRLAFTDHAWDTLEECRTRPSFVWEVLHRMATELYDQLHADPANAYKNFTNNTGWKCSRGEGTMTRRDARLMENYKDTYKGYEINIEAHVKNGVKESDPKFIRVHFAYEPEIEDKIIIGHCGLHIDNYTTQKIK